MPRTVTSHRAAASGASSRVAGSLVLAALLAGAVLFPAPATAQAPEAPPDAAAAPPTDVEAPPATEPPTPDEEAEPAPAGPALPPDFTPPPAEIPEVMTLRNPLMTDEEIKKEDADLQRSRINSILIGGDPSNDNKNLLQRWANLKIAQMTAVKEWDDIGEISREMMLVVRGAARSQTNSNRKREFREALCAAMTEACKSVIFDNNFYVRLQAAVILAQLDVVPEEPVGRNRDPAEAYVPAAEPLVELLERDDQLPALKIAAAAGIGRIADHGVIPTQLKYRAGEVMVTELAKADTHWWYQMRLAEALAAIDLDVNQDRQPIVIQALLDALADDSRHCLARSAAAKALSRTRIPAGGLDENAAADRLVKLARDMSLKYNKNPAATHWHQCYWMLVDAFKPVSQDEVSRLPTDSLLRRGSLPSAYEDAMGRILPVARHVFQARPGMANQPIPQELIQRLNEPLAAAP